MNKTFLGAFLASVFISFTACSEENLEQDTNPPTEQPGDSTDPDDSGEDQQPEYPTPDRSTVAAFPGAEGAGKLTSGGAGGTVYTLSSLKDDESEYVRKSIGNALKDISKKYPELVSNELKQWDLSSKEIKQVHKLASAYLNKS